MQCKQVINSEAQMSSRKIKFGVYDSLKSNNATLLLIHKKNYI